MNTKYTFKALLCGISIWAGMSLGLTSCESYLDVDSYFYDQTNIDSIFQSKVRVNEYINGIATILPDESKLFTSSYFPFGMGSDECFASWADDYGKNEKDPYRHAAMALLLGDETPQSANYNNWGSFYKGIRKANIVLTRISECKDLSDMERRDYTGRTYFLRGYFYFSLLRQYGPVPIVPDKPFDADTPSDEASIERSTYDECIDYICSDMEKAAEFLPDSRTQQFQYIASKGAALAVMSRLRLYAASPWYNGNTRYADWKTADGRNFISQNNDNSKWGVAAVAAKRIIDMGKYALFTTARTERTQELPSNISQAGFPDGAGNIDPYASYKSLFDGSVNAELVPEYIYYCNAIVKENSPQWLATPTALGGANGINLCMDLIDSYKMIDGYDIHHSSANYPYPDASHAGDPIDIAYRVSDGYTVNGNVAKVDAYREPRFYATIGYNHCIWPGTSYVGNDPVTNVEVTYYSDGNAGPLPEYPDNYNISSMNAVIRAGESYARIPVAIHPEGLHCDSLYALPLKMESCKEYPVAQAETVVLFAIKTYNNYSGYYNYIGTNNGASFSLIRNAVAVNKNTIRIYYTGTEELARAKDTGLTITVNEDNTLSLAGWKNLNVTEGSGSYDPQNKTFSFTCKVNGNEVEAYLISATASEE